MVFNMARNIYLDYAAATPLDPRVLRAMQPYFGKEFYNPSATYLVARSVRQALEKARAQIAVRLGVRPAEVIFTAGATEANNLAIQGLMKSYPDGEVLVSAIEHESVLAPAKLFKSKLMPVDKRGIVDLEKLEAMVNDQTVLVSVGLVNNEIGTIQPLGEISQILNKLSKSRQTRGVKNPLYLHTDAAQAGNWLDLHVSRLGVDLLSLNGGKLYGPKQSGVLYVRAGVKLEPLVLGGGQEFGLRSGTENVPSAIGLATALCIAQKERRVQSEKITALREGFESELSRRLPNTVINGQARHRAPHILSVTFPGVDNERLMMQLDEAGIQVAVGSACSASSDEPSHVLGAIGLSEAAARSTLRFSFGRSTTSMDIAKTIGRLAQFTDSTN